ncbi:ScyD/ScyE family protein [Nocardioides marmotae]|nr:ScyD/ScyE family protein [Nocardioides marmotae]
MTRPRTTLLAALTTLTAGAALAASTVGPAQARVAPEPDDLTTIASLSGPRGVDSVGRGLTLVTEDDGTFSLVVERRGGPAVVRELGGLPAAAGFAQAISAARGKVYFLTGGGAAAADIPPGGATLYSWTRAGGLQVVADLAAYQAEDPDPYDIEDVPTDTNPFGLHALRDGTVLVADAGNNDLLRVWPDGTVKTVARFAPRVVAIPDNLPEEPPAAPLRLSAGRGAGDTPAPAPMPPMIPAESVTTSVTVGADGYWYVSELRGFPATPGTSQVWRIRPGSEDAVCDPAPYDAHQAAPRRHHRPACTRYADGLTSIVDLAADRKGGIYALSLSKASWLQAEAGTPGAEVGGLFRITSHRHHTHTRELVPGELNAPGGVDVARNGDIYLTGPVLGPGSLMVWYCPEPCLTDPPGLPRRPTRVAAGWVHGPEQQRPGLRRHHRLGDVPADHAGQHPLRGVAAGGLRTRLPPGLGRARGLLRGQHGQRDGDPRPREHRHAPRRLPGRGHRRAGLALARAGPPRLRRPRRGLLNRTTYPAPAPRPRCRRGFPRSLRFPITRPGVTSPGPHGWNQQMPETTDPDLRARLRRLIRAAADLDALNLAFFTAETAVEDHLEMIDAASAELEDAVRSYGERRAQLGPARPRSPRPEHDGDQGRPAGDVGGRGQPTGGAGRDRSPAVGDEGSDAAAAAADGLVATDDRRRR